MIEIFSADIDGNFLSGIVTTQGPQEDSTTHSYSSDISPDTPSCALPERGVRPGKPRKMPGLLIRPFPKNPANRPDSFGASFRPGMAKSSYFTRFKTCVSFRPGFCVRPKVEGRKKRAAKRCYGALERIICGSNFGSFGNPGVSEGCFHVGEGVLRR